MTRSHNAYSSVEELLAVGAGATIFAALGISAHNDLLDDLNRRVRSLLLRADPNTVRIAGLMTLLSETAVHPLLGYLLSRSVSRVTGRKTYVPLYASIANFVLNKGTRLIVQQKRPPGTKPRVGLDRHSYPSGHTLAATTIAFATALELAEGRDASERKWLFAAAAAYAGTLGWTRLVLDQHWVDDIVGAWAGGIALAILVHRAGKRQGPRRRSYSRTGN